jgi:hypothetical protein
MAFEGYCEITHSLNMYAMKFQEFMKDSLVA